MKITKKSIKYWLKPDDVESIGWVICLAFVLVVSVYVLGGLK